MNKIEDFLRGLEPFAFLLLQLISPIIWLFSRITSLVNFQVSHVSEIVTMIQAGTIFLILWFLLILLQAFLHAMGYFSATKFINYFFLIAFALWVEAVNVLSCPQVLGRALSPSTCDPQMNSKVSITTSLLEAWTVKLHPSPSQWSLHFKENTQMLNFHCKTQACSGDVTQY